MKKTSIVDMFKEYDRQAELYEKFGIGMLPEMRKAFVDSTSELQDVEMDLPVLIVLPFSLFGFDRLLSMVRLSKFPPANNVNFLDPKGFETIGNGIQGSKPYFLTDIRVLKSRSENIQPRMLPSLEQVLAFVIAKPEVIATGSPYGLRGLTAPCTKHGDHNMVDVYRYADRLKVKREPYGETIDPEWGTISFGKAHTDWYDRYVNQ